MSGKLLLCLTAAILVVRVASAEPQVQAVKLPRGVVALHRAGSAVVVEDREGGFYRVRMNGGDAVLAPLDGFVPEGPGPRPDMLPDGEVTTGRGEIAQAWLTGPTERYGHGVLGDAIEASGLRVELRSGATASLTLGSDSVFEDRRVRLADVDGDGRDEMVVVRSYLDRGAALAVFRVGPAGIETMAETAPLGRPDRWLNPIGVADFDGDGRPEIAVVTTPHIGGTLRLYGLSGGRLREELAEAGFSNHVIGSPTLDLAAVVDVNGDGVSDMLVPDAERKRLMAVTANRGEITYLWEIRHRAPVVTALVLSDYDGDRSPDLTYGLADGTVVVLSDFVVRPDATPSH